MPKNDEITEKVNEEVKAVIKREGRSVSQVAYRLGVSPQSLGSMLRGKYNMSVIYLLNILNALGHYELVITTSTKAKRLKAEDRNDTVFILGGSEEEK